MKVSLDGGETWLDSEKGEFSGEVMIHYDLLPEEMQLQELHIKCTDEGVVMDTWEHNGEYLAEEECTGSTSEMASEIFDRLAGDDGPSRACNQL